MKTCLRKLKLYGDLAEYLDVKEIEIDVATVAKSIRCLLAYYPQAEHYMMNRSYKVLVEDRPTEVEEIHYPAGKGDIKIIPVLAGEGGRGLNSIILGGILIGAAIFTGGGTLAFWYCWSWFYWWSYHRKFWYRCICEETLVLL